MFLNIAKFEINFFRKQPSFYVTGLLFFLIPFFIMISSNIQIGGANSAININSTSAITNITGLMSLIGMFLVANFIGSSATRDYTLKMEGIIFSTPATKFDYLWGKFLGSYLICLIIFTAVPLGILIGSFWPTVNPERLGPTLFRAYVESFVIFAIPNFLFLSAITYLLGNKVKSMMAVYLGIVFLLVFYSIGQSLLSDPQYIKIAAILDPFGSSTYTLATRYWTPFEKNFNFIPLTQELIINRLLWIGLSLIILLFAHYLIDPRKQAKLGKNAQKFLSTSTPTISTKYYTPEQGNHVDRLRFFHRTIFEIKQVIKSPSFVILTLISLISLITVFFTKTGTFGVPDLPLTRTMVEFIIGSLFTILMVIITFYTAETIWRERQLGIGDIIDVTPIKNWSVFFPKVLALIIIPFILSSCAALITMIYQLSQSYYDLQLHLYIILLSTSLVLPFALLTILSSLIQVLSPNKYVGMMIFVVYYILSLVMSNYGFEHRLWRFAKTSSLIYSDLNGFGHFVEGFIWYNIYWTSLSIVMLVLSFGLWSRGIEFAIGYRFRLLKNTIGKTGMTVAVLALLIFVGSGSYIYYNTRILNDFFTDDQELDARAEYEKQYKQYKDLPLPIITDVYAEVDIFPQQRKVVLKGHYQITNQGITPIEKFLVIWDSSKNRSMQITMQNTKEVDRNEKFGTMWLQLDKPLMPGEKAQLNFAGVRDNKGFKDSGTDTRIVANGTFLNNFEFFPSFGYNLNSEIKDPHERSKRDLEPLERMAKLEDSKFYNKNYIDKASHFVNFEAIVSTSVGQKAIAPGYLQKEWQENGRHFFHYKMNAPILNFFSFLSGDWQLTKDTHKGINLEIYHHPKHNMNIESMMSAMKASLDYLGQEFSPYQHQQARIIEFPLYASYAQSFPNTIPYSENMGFISDIRKQGKYDIVAFVTAHELAHQWWAHQVTGAAVQGASVISESLAQYSAYMVMEKMFGPDHLRRFLKTELDRYLQSRGREILEEMPLYKEEFQQYIHYQKGGNVMYALKDMFGEKVINTALKNFLQTFQYKHNPYPTTLDLIRFLKAEIPAEGHAMVDDLFTKITIYDLKVKSAEAKKLENNKYEVSITTESKKFYATGKGEQTETPLSQLIDIGIFSSDPTDSKTVSQPLYFKKETIRSGEGKFSFVVDKLPTHVGIDPYVKMIDRDTSDNILKVEVN